FLLSASGCERRDALLTVRKVGGTERRSVPEAPDEAVSCRVRCQSRALAAAPPRSTDTRPSGSVEKARDLARPGTLGCMQSLEPPRTVFRIAEHRGGSGAD